MSVYGFGSSSNIRRIGRRIGHGTPSARPSVPPSTDHVATAVEAVLRHILLVEIYCCCRRTKLLHAFRGGTERSGQARGVRGGHSFEDISYEMRAPDHQQSSAKEACWSGVLEHILLPSASELPRSLHSFGVLLTLMKVMLADRLLVSPFGYLVGRFVAWLAACSAGA